MPAWELLFSKQTRQLWLYGQECFPLKWPIYARTSLVPLPYLLPFCPFLPHWLAMTTRLVMSHGHNAHRKGLLSQVSATVDRAKAARTEHLNGAVPSYSLRCIAALRGGGVPHRIDVYHRTRNCERLPHPLFQTALVALALSIFRSSEFKSSFWGSSWTCALQNLVNWYQTKSQAWDGHGRAENLPTVIGKSTCIPHSHINWLSILILPCIGWHIL